MTGPIRKSIHVPLAPAAAFRLFTGGIERWWPVETHSLSASRANGRPRTVRMEPRPGGRIIETLPDGTEAPWATITAWEPGARLSLDWYVGRPAMEATKVEVTFATEDGGTRVRLEHSGFERLGEEAAPLRNDYNGGWDFVLGERFGGFCRSEAVQAP